jgi:hypothetical protein
MVRQSTTGNGCAALQGQLSHGCLGDIYTEFEELGVWLDGVFGDLLRQLRWSFLPPLMVYFAAGISGLTAIVGVFFVKDYLGLSAAFLAGLGFWAGLPWTLKLPLGHLVDILWRWKAVLVYAGAAMIAVSLLIMYALIIRTAEMAQIAPVEAWYVVSVLLAPFGYVLQDAVADAMSVEAVPRINEDGAPISEERAKALHTTMQTLGRIALIGGSVAVAAVNIVMFSGVESMSQAQKADVYSSIYLYALLIPLISVVGVTIAAIQLHMRRRNLEMQGISSERAEELLTGSASATEPNYWYFVGGAGFIALTLAIGLSDLPAAQEIVFLGSMVIIVLLMRQLVSSMDEAKAHALIGTAVIIFVFRAVPLPGPGATWFEIDVLGFDERFLAILSLITSLLAIFGMIVLRPLMARRTITWIVALLTIASAVLALPNIGLYYGLNHWTAPLTGGIVDARFIAIMDTAVESPLGQIAMIPMLAWLARNAPSSLKATFFAVMASFTNLALSASSLATKHLNRIFMVTREVSGPGGEVSVPADYSELGWLLITVAIISLIAPLVTILIVQSTVFRSSD